MTKKFRVWDKQDKSFLSKEYLKEFKVSISWDGQTIHQDFWGGTKIIGEDVFVQQWTGLTDSQGVEIYEGDIIFTIYPEYKIAKVFFCANSASFRLLSGNVALPMVTMRTQEKQSPKLINVFEKVIGNIFQNPELLEKS